MPTWSDRYNELFTKKQFDIPDRASTITFGEYVESRDVSLDLGATFPLASPFRYLYADTITTTNPVVTLPASSGIDIFTRIFLADVAQPELTVECPKGPAAFTLYTLSFLPGTRIVVNTGSSSQSYEPNLTADQYGLSLAIDAGGSITYQALAWVDDNEFKVDGQLHRLLRTQFAIAAAWLGSAATASYAVDILNFILRFTRTSTLTTEIRMQALTLLAQSSVRGDANAKGLTYVPPLAFSAYDTVVKMNIAVAEAYEKEYNRYSDLEAGSKVWIEAATIMKDQYTDLSNMCATLVKQAQGRYDGAEKALQENNRAFEDAQSAVSLAQDVLRLGYIKWLKEQNKEAIFGVFKALFDLALAVGGCVLGQPEAAEAAVEAGKTAEKAYEAAQATTVAGSAVDKLLKGIKELPKLFEKMAEIATAVVALFVRISKAITAATSPDAGKVDSPDGDVSANFVAALASWDVYLDELEVSMKFPISEGISGAEEYRLAARKMAILGKALLLSKMAAISQGQELARTLLQLRVNKEQQERLSHWITQLDKSEDAYMQAQVLLFNRLLDVRGWIYIYLQLYIDSYRYWALTPSTVQPSMVETVAQYKKDHATLAFETEIVQAYTNLDPAPQNFRRVFNWGSTRSFPNDDILNLNDDILESLRRTKTASFVITPGHLPGYARVRVDTIRIYLQGITGTYEDPVRLQIMNDGIYLDRTISRGNQKSQELSFYSSPLRRAFYYTSEGQTPVMDGDVAFPFQYFRPTPFAKWSVTVKSDFEPSHLTGLKLELIGDAIPL